MIDDNTVQIRRCKPEDLEALRTSAKADEHAAFRPSHVVTKNGEIIGCLEIATIPMVMFWMHTEKAKARDCVAVKTFYENFTANLGGGQTLVAVPCAEKSPLLPFMEQMGYVDAKQKLFLKEL